jgi:general secretion pathway protein H
MTHWGGASARRPDAGFTLVEMMIVIALLVLISVLALPNLSSVFRLSLNASTREVASLVRECNNSAVITKRVYRLAWDLDHGQFWVESGPDSVLLDSTASRELRERRGADANGEPAKFTLDKTVTRKKSELPSGVKFEDVITEQAKEPITSGMAYTHFFPHGLIEQSVVHLKDTYDHQTSLIILPVGGKLKVEDEYVSAEDAFGKK